MLMIGRKIDGMNKTPFLPGNQHDRAMALIYKPKLWVANLVVNLEEQIIKGCDDPKFLLQPYCNPR